MPTRCRDSFRCSNRFQSCSCKRRPARPTGPAPAGHDEELLSGRPIWFWQIGRVRWRQIFRRLVLAPMDDSLHNRPSVLLRLCGRRRTAARSATAWRLRWQYSARSAAPSCAQSASPSCSLTALRLERDTRPTVSASASAGCATISPQVGDGPHSVVVQSVSMPPTSANRLLLSPVGSPESHLVVTTPCTTIGCYRSIAVVCCLHAPWP